MPVKKAIPFGIPAKAPGEIATDTVRAALENAQSVLDQQRRLRMTPVTSLGEPRPRSIAKAPPPVANINASEESSDLRNFLWGAGDAVLLGFGDELRDAAEIDAVDMNSKAYTAGDIVASAAMLATGVGGGIRAAGMARKGYEFSHFVPKRLLPKSMKSARSIWNGNYVPVKTHALSDPFRYRFMPKWWKWENPMPNRVHQLWVRTPNTAKGTTAGVAAAGTGFTRSGEE